MFTPPTPPETLVTLQVECVACRERFVVAEGEQRARAGEQKRQWQPAAAGQPRLDLRFLPQRNRKAVTPSPRPDVFETAPQPETPSAQTAIVCPRCGADNRNWVKILHTPIWEQWRVLWPALLGLLITGAICLMAYNRFGNKFEETERIFFFIALLLAGALPSLFLPMAWRQQREYRNARGLLLTVGPVSPLLSMALTFFLIVVFILPGALFVVMPLGFESVERLLSPPPAEPTLTARIQTVRDQVETVLNGASEEKKTAAQEAVAGLEALQAEAVKKAEAEAASTITPTAQISATSTGTAAPEGATERQERESTDWNGRAQAVLKWASQYTQENPASPLPARIVSPVVALEALTSTPPEPVVNQEFLKTWLKYTLTVSLFASLCGALASALRASAVDPHLPYPIYYSLAEMSRVVGWEVKRVLELPGDMSQMEWQTAERNQLGGLTLVGIIRSAAGIGAAYVPARRYEVVSDPWGRIVYTNMTYIQAPNLSAPAVVDASPSEAEEIHHILTDLFRARPTYLSL